jgi:hypothetical protein
LFSDGYTDQFGGEVGKKFMTVSEKNFWKKTTKTNERTISVNKRYFLQLEKGIEQVDDVIFMGVRL